MTSIIVGGVLLFAAAFIIGHAYAQIRTLESLRKEIWNKGNSLDVVKFIGYFANRYL